MIGASYNDDLGVLISKRLFYIFSGGLRRAGNDDEEYIADEWIC